MRTGARGEALTALSVLLRYDPRDVLTPVYRRLFQAHAG
jgi:hypothetical protein